MPSSSKPKYETGTSNHEDVDYDWLPKETIKQLSKTNSFKKNFIQFYFFFLIKINHLIRPSQVHHDKGGRRKNDEMISYYN